VFFLTGTDENATRNEQAAKEQGIPTRQLVDKHAAEFRQMADLWNISYDRFIRTVDPDHVVGVQEFVRRWIANDDVYLSKYEGLYCRRCEAFYEESDLVDENGGHDGPRVRCPIHTSNADAIQRLNEENYFFRLSKYEQKLKDLYRDNPEFCVPEIRRNEVLGWLDRGLRDVSVSRRNLTWGIPFPDKPGHTVYVWFDALINYAAAVGYGWDDELFKKWWPANLHVVGKDITRFHCVIWPAMLMSARLPLPGQVFGHGWVYFKGERMSKTMGNIVDPLDAANKFGPDPLRLYLAKEIPYGGDGDFTWERFEEKYNADLANNLGNLVNRVASMTERYQQGRIRSTGGGSLAAVAAESVSAYRSAMNVHALHEGAAAAFRLVSAANNHIAETQPWALAKDPAKADRLNGVLADTSEAVRIAATLLAPIMPSSAIEILRRLGDDRPLKDRRLDTDTAWRTSGEKQILNAGALWPRIEADKGVVNVSEESQKPVGAPATQAGQAPAAPQAPQAPKAPEAPQAPGIITIDDFAKVELKTAKVLEAERMPKSQRLLKLKVDAGEAEPRTILAGIAESYEPEQLIGKSVVIVANLAPRKMMGLESNGMVLAASPDGGKAFVLNSEPAPPGTRVR